MGTQLLTEEEIQQRLGNAPEWKQDGKAIVRQLTFGNFREAISFLVLIAFDAEEADHHPDVTINYRRLTLSLSTHSEGGLTAKDFSLATKIDAAQKAFSH